MDRRDTFLLVACLLALMFWPFAVNKIWPPKPLPPEQMAAATGTVVRAEMPGSEPVLRAQAPPPPEPKDLERFRGAAPAAVLENDLMRLDVVAEGGGIRAATLKAHKAEGEEPIALNRHAEGPLFELRFNGDSRDLRPWEVVSKDARSAVLRARPLEGLEVTKRFEVSGDYTTVATVTFSNATPEAMALPAVFVNCGTAGPVHETDQQLYIGADWFDGSQFKAQQVTDFDKSGFLFFTFREARTTIDVARPLDWVTSRNQFFVTLIDPREQKFDRLALRPVELPKFRPTQPRPPKGMLALGELPPARLEPGASATVTFENYTGPREYWRLKGLGDEKRRVMNFGFFGWVSVLLLNLMNALHKFTHNYGISIILMVAIIRAVFWPLQTKANRTMKQMQSLKPELEKIQKQYKDQPEKLHAEMLNLYQTYGVSPLGGCLPLLVQLPVFFGFYSMLLSAVELRHQSFLWIADLSQPDTIWHIPGLDFPLNLLPLLMGATSIWQTHVTPMSGMEKSQVMMMKFMPLLFVVICYNFSSALALYWTVQNLIAVFQTYRNLAQPAPKLEKKKRPKGRWAMLMEQARQAAESEKEARRRKKQKGRGN